MPFQIRFQTVCVSPTACVRRAALAAPFRQCAAPNSPFKLFAYCRQLVYGGRLTPHPSGNVPVQIRLSNCLHIADSLCTVGGSRRTLLTFYLCFLFCLSKNGNAPVQIRLLNCLRIATVCVRRAALAAPF